MNFFNLTNSFISNLLTAGVLLSFLLMLLEYISQSINLVSFYSFISGSFIVIAFFQYYTILNENPDATLSFLIHSIIGGIFWVIYSIIMYYAHISGLNKFSVIFITASIFILFSIIYLHLILTKKINF